MDLSKAQGFIANLPNEGLFRSSSDFGSTVYRRIGNRIEQFNMTDLLTPQELSSAGNMGNAAGMAKDKLSQMGVNWDSLPSYNIGDVGTAARKAGVDAGPIWGTSPNKVASVQELLKSAPSQGSRALSFNTPTDIATAQTQLAGAQASQPASDLLHKQQTERTQPQVAGATATAFPTPEKALADFQSGKMTSEQYNTWASQYQQLQTHASTLAETVAQGAIENGKTLDPNADYSLVDFTSFLDQAKGAVSPYYQSKISGLVDTFKQNMASLGADLSAFETKTTKEAEQTKLSGEETLAGRGMAFSSGREAFTTNLAEQTRTTLEEQRRGTAEAAQRGLTGLEQDIGTTGVQSALGTTPTIGGRQLTFGTTPAVGEIPYTESESTINRARALASDENTRRTAARATLGFA